MVLNHKFMPLLSKIAYEPIKMCDFSENFIFNKIIPHLKSCSLNSIFSNGIWTPQAPPSVIAMDTAQNFTDRKELKTPLFYPN